MAGVLSGSFSKAYDKNGVHKIGIKWTATQNATNLTSSVKATIFYQITNSSYSIHKNSSTTVTITINGTKYTGSGTIGNLDGAETVDLWSKTVTLKHNSSGKLELELSGTVAVNATLSGTYYGTQETGEETFTVKDIEVAPTVKTVTLSTLSHTSLKFAFTSSSAITKMEYRYKKSSTSTWGGWTSKTLSSVTSGSVNLTGLDIGTSYDAQMRLYNSAGKYYTSATKTASTYNAPTASGLTNIELNNAALSVPFTVSNQANKAYLKTYISIQYGDQDSEVNNSVLSVNLGAYTNGNTYTWQLSQSNVNTIANLLKTPNGKLRIRIESFSASSYSSTSKIADTYSPWVYITLNTTTYAPKFTGSLTMTRDSVADDIYSSSSYSNHIIQNQTTMSYSFTAATGQQSATIESYKIECFDYNGGTSLGSKSISTISGEYGTVNFAGTIVFRVTAVDSRGLSSYIESSTFISNRYTVPTLSADVKRDSDDTGNAKITFYGSISNLGGLNAISSFQYQYKEISVEDPTGTYGSAHNISSSNYNLTYSSETDINQIESKESGIVIGGLEAGSNYVFKFTLTDKISTVSVETNLSEGIPIIRILSNGQFSVNGLPDLDLEDYKLFVHGNSYVYGSCKTDSGFYESSLEELKTGIVSFDSDPYEIIENSDIYKYYLKSSLSKGDTKERIGFVIGDDYNIDESILSYTGKEIDIYSCIGVLWKGEQKIIRQIKQLEKENQELRQIIKNYENQNNGLN